ncbi:MAG: S8 family peptidase [Candidatus Kapabacteria bacterium]|nr:S8 family peptidase [Candidatus Kapabacteria bacterium]
MNKLIQSFCAMAAFAAVIAGCSSDVSMPVDTASGKQDGKILAAPSGFKKVPDQYVIVFKANEVGDNEVQGEVRRLQKAHGLTIGHIYETAIVGFSATVPPGVLKKLAADDKIQRIEEDYEITVAPVEEFAKPGGGGTVARTQPQQTPWGVSATGWRDGTGKRAWIIDSGIDPNHPDLNVSTTLSKNFVTGSRQSSLTWQDKNGHGTHVAGTIAAKNDGYDVIGVAPGATVIAVRCLDSRGSGQYSWIIAGVNYVAASGTAGDVCNMSLGGPAYNALDDAIRAAANDFGIKFAIAAGNEYVDCTATSPARAGEGQPDIWTVSAHNDQSVFAYFSNYGAPVDICAPGVSVTSTKMGGGLTTMSGTSMAAPHVAGILLVGTVGSRGAVTGDPDAKKDNMAVIQ